MNHNSLLAAGIATIAIATVPRAVGAQDVPEPESNARAELIDEIIVTAQRRSERLQDVPATVDVIGAAKLESAGITSTQELTTSVPGLNFSNNGTFPSPTIRGISSQSVGAGAENAVAMYLDGSYIPSQLGALFDLPDVSQVEVLKGPQGTLYGRNATGGAILITTADPGNEFGFRGNVSYGRFNDFNANASVSIPIVKDKLAVGLSGGNHTRDGYVRDIVNDAKRGDLDANFIKVKVLFTPTESMRWTLSAMRAKLTDESVFAGTTVNTNTAAKLATRGAAIVPTQPFTTALDYPSFLRNEARLLALKGEIDLPIGQLTTISAYNETKSYLQTDSDYTASDIGANINIDLPADSFTQDLYLRSRKLGPVELLAGYSYFTSSTKNDPLEAVGRTVLFSEVERDTHAFFAEVQIDFTEKLNLILGGRYTDEDASMTRVVLPVGGPAAGEDKFSNFSPSAVIQYKIPDIGNVYGSYKEGFKSGDYSSFGPPQATRPETIDAYEVGYKSDFGGDFAVNVAAFYYDYTDLIASVSVSGSSIFTNASSAVSKGVEMNAIWQPSRSVSLSAGGAYVDATFGDYENGLGNVPRPATACAAVGASYPCGNVTTPLDLTDLHLPRAPKFTGTLSGEFREDLGRGEIVLYADLYHSSRFFWEPSNRIDEGAYTVVNGRVSWRPDNAGPLTVAIWGRNLTDATYAKGANITNTADTKYYALPRTYGVSASVRF